MDAKRSCILILVVRILQSGEAVIGTENESDEERWHDEGNKSDEGENEEDREKADEDRGHEE